MLQIVNLIPMENTIMVVFSHKYKKTHPVNQHGVSVITVNHLFPLLSLSAPAAGLWKGRLRVGRCVLGGDRTLQ